MCLVFSCVYVYEFLFFLMIRRPPRTTRTDTRFPYTTLFRSDRAPVLDTPHGLYRAGAALPAGWRRRSRLGEGHGACGVRWDMDRHPLARSEEHTSELQSLMRLSYAVFCLQKKTIQNDN